MTTEINNLEAEQTVLGSIMLDNSAFDEAREIIEASDFYAPRHTMIWQHMEALRHSGTPIDAVTLSNSLGANIEKIGGLIYLVGLPDTVPTSVYIKHYSLIVREKSNLRRLSQAGQKIIKLANDATIPSLELLTAATQLLNEIAVTKHSTDNAAPLMDGLSEQYENNKLRGSGITTPGIVYTGIRAFDDVVGGFEPGQLIVIGGKPGMGKTILGQQIGEYEAEQGNYVRMQSLEMTRSALLDRAMSRRAQVDYTRIRFGSLKPGSESEKRVMALSSIPFFIDDRSGLTVDEIALTVQRAHRKTPLTLLIVDHMHIIKKRTINHDVAELGYIVDTLKILAKNLNIVVIVLAQLNRADEGKPGLQSLRGSGDIEAAADTVIFPWRESYSKPNSQDFTAELIIAKGRNMILGSIPVSYCGAYQCFGEPDRTWK